MWDELNHNEIESDIQQQFLSYHMNWVAMALWKKPVVNLEPHGWISRAAWMRIACLQYLFFREPLPALIF